MIIDRSPKEMLAARSIIYGAVSALFADPESEKFSMLMRSRLQGSIIDACFQLEGSGNRKEPTLSRTFQKLMSKLDRSSLEKIRDEFVDVFGHTLSKQIAPYALEHLKNSDVFFRTQKLADLNGFYKAFGMEVGSIERADHISTQSEFLSFLLLKELVAGQNVLYDEKEVCEKAFYDFQNDHFLDWVDMFANNMVNNVTEEFYYRVGAFLKKFLETEKMYFNLVKDTQEC